MSEREKKTEQEEEMQTNRGGRESGGTPDYEKAQSPSTPQGDFDNSKSSF